MTRSSLFILYLLCITNSEFVVAQSAEIELKFLTGECSPKYSPTQDSLLLYSNPDLRSESNRIKYQKNWHIPYSDEMTRVISFGKVTSTDPSSESSYEYLYYLGEGFAKLRHDDKEYELDIVTNPKFSIESHPDVQGWIKLEYKDKSSPGWLFLNGEQVKVYGVSC